MSKVESPCKKCGKCLSPDSAYSKCKRWRGWFGAKWRIVARRGEALMALRAQNPGDGILPGGGQKQAQEKVPDKIHESHNGHKNEVKPIPDVSSEGREKGDATICEYCGKPFILRNGNAIYCSAQCRVKARHRERYHPGLEGWDEVVQKCSETHLSYGQMVQKGLL